MQNCHPVNTQMTIDFIPLLKTDRVVYNKPYRELIGSLLYLLGARIPIFCFAVVLSHFQDKLDNCKWSAAKRVLCYL